MNKASTAAPQDRRKIVTRSGTHATHGKSVKRSSIFSHRKN